MARETKFGLLFVLVLASAFGLLVFKRLHQPLALMAESEAEALDEETSETLSEFDAPVAGLASAGESQSPLQVPAAEPIPRPVSPTLSTSSTTAVSPGTTVSSAATGTTGRTSLPAAAAPQRPALPADLDDDFFAAPVADKSATAPPALAAPATAGISLPRATAVPQELADDFPPAQPAATMAAQPASTAPLDPFDFPENSAPAGVTATPAARTGNPAKEAFDPFADGPAVEGPQIPTRVPATANTTPPDFPNPEPAAQGSPAAATPVADPFFEGTGVSTVPPTTPAMAAPAETSAADPFADPEPSPTQEQSPAPVVVTTPQPEDFFDTPRSPEPRTSSQEPRTASVSPPVVELPQKDADPFAVPLPVPAVNNPPSAAAAMTEPPRPVQGFTEEELGGFRPVRVSDNEASSTTVIQRQPVQTVDPDPFETSPQPATKSTLSVPSKFTDSAASVAPAGRLPAQVDEFPSAPTDRVASPVAFTGETYVVQPSDSFWTISKRVYGTGRYFRALAKHNESIIGDPDKLRPNMTVATPPATELDRLYRAEIPLAASSAVQQIREGDPARYQPDGEPGFFVHSSGQPMYRVGSNDTLSDIAFNHLGRASRWIQVFEMNRDILKDGNTLSIGTVLKLPGDASQVRVVGFESSDR